VACGGVRLLVLLNQELGAGVMSFPLFRLDYGCVVSIDVTLYPLASTYGCIRDVCVPCDVVVVMDRW